MTQNRPWIPYLLILPALVTLLFLFIGALKVAERVFDGPPVLFVGLAALLLWMPQYMIFFVWRGKQA